MLSTEAAFAQTCGTGSCFPSVLGHRWCGPDRPYRILVFFDASVSGPKGDAVKKAFLGPNGNDGAIEAWNFETDWGNCIPLYLVTAGFTDRVITVRLADLGPGLRAKAPPCPTYPSCPEAKGFDAEIIFNTAEPLETEHQQFTRNTAIHELGHSLGLAHDDCCAAALMAPGQQGSPPTAVDGGAVTALKTIYGDLCEGFCGVRRRRWVRPSNLDGAELTVNFGRYDGCVRDCGGTPGGGAIEELAAPLTYELALRDADDAMFNPFATLTESQWSAGQFAHKFSEGHLGATVRLRVFDGATLIEEVVTYPEFDIPVPTGTSALGVDTPWLRAGPNPSDGPLQVEFGVPARMQVEIAALDVAGRKLGVVTTGTFDAGVHRAEIRPGDLQGARWGSVVFVRMRVDGHVITHMVVLLR